MNYSRIQYHNQSHLLFGTRHSYKIVCSTSSLIKNGLLIFKLIEHLGQATVPLSGILGKNKTADKWAPLEKSPKKKKSKVNGQLHFIITIQVSHHLYL